MATILLVRHGETTWNRDRRLQGWTPTPLTDRGREQARLIADHVAGEYVVDRVVASDLRRAVETARPLARATGAPLALERGWRERSVGVLEGLTYEAVAEGYPEFDLSSVGYAALEATPERGESLLATRERVLDALDDLVAGLGDGETVAVVAHGGPIRMVLGDLEGLDLVTAVSDLDVANASVTELLVRDGSPELGTVGEVAPGAAETSQDSPY